MTVMLGEILCSQLVNAYSASMVLSGETPFGKWITISTFSAVLSSIFFTRSFPLSFAFKTLSIKEPVVVPKGISVITKVLSSSFFILALTLILPPLNPSLYWLISAIPPVKKSGSILVFLPRSASILASIISIKLCGRILQANPTAIPSAPCANKTGNLAGSVSGSLALPS